MVAFDESSFELAEMLREKMVEALGRLTKMLTGIKGFDEITHGGRVMLSGTAQLRDAVVTVNEGQVFR